MASTYAHYVFGQDVLNELSETQKQIILKNRELYDIGLHGPDILFYYQPLKKNPICSLGYDLHEKPGKVFFESAIKIYHKQNKQDLHLSYLYGVICHFALDAKCHPYVEKYRRENNVSHTSIEVNFDRYLLEKNGFNPLKYPLSCHIHPSIDRAEIISPYFTITTPKDILKALKSMNFYHHLLHASYSFKRQALYLGMDLVGQKEFKEHIIAKKANPRCQQSNQNLDQLMQEAIHEAVHLIQSFDQSRTSDCSLSVGFEHTFGEN